MSNMIRNSLVAILAVIGCAASAAQQPGKEGSAARNIAYRRAVYQSSAADFTHVGHLVTDGLRSGGTLETRVEFPDNRGGESGGFQSRWVSKTGRDEWLKIDLGAPSRVDAVKVDWTKGGEASDWAVELSSDGETWTEGTCGKDVRFVKLVCRQAKGAYFAVDEIEVEGANALKSAETGWKLAPAREVTATGAELSQAGYDDSAWLPAVVPGTVVMSYLKAGAIPDMNYADNQLMISDGYFYDDFWYRHAFTVPTDKKGLMS